MSFFNNFINVINNIDLEDILFYLTSGEFQETLLPARIVFLLIIAIMLGVIIFTISRTHYFQWMFYRDASSFLRMGSIGAKKMTRQWNKILARLQVASESEYKLAVIEADDMLDTTLKKMGYDGQTIEEKLGKLTSAVMPNIEQLHEIHRLRDHIVHDPDYRLTIDEAKKALEVYGRSFRDLQILAE